MITIKKLTVFSLLLLTTTVAYGMEEKKGPIFENFEKLPEDIKIEVLYQHINNFINDSRVTQEEYDAEYKRLSELPDDADGYDGYNKKSALEALKKPGSPKRVNYNDVTAELSKLKTINQELKKIIDSDKFKARIAPLLEQKFGKRPTKKEREEANEQYNKTLEELYGKYANRPESGWKK